MVIVSLVVGSLLGAVAGFVGGVIDEVIMRVADVTLAFPSIVLALAICVPRAEFEQRDFGGVHRAVAGVRAADAITSDGDPVE